MEEGEHLGCLSHVIGARGKAGGLSSIAHVHGNDAGTSLLSSDCLPNSNISPSPELCTAPGFIFGAALSPPATSRTRPQGVCSNVGSMAQQPLKVSGCVDSHSNPWHSKASAWKKPSVIPLPSVEELGRFSLDGATAILDEEEVDATLKRFECALIGRMFGRRFPFSVLNGELIRKWGAFGKFRIVTLSNDCFVCFFDNVEARDAVLLGGPWVVLGQVLGVDRCSSTFSPASLDGFKTPVWVRMPRLPLYCWGSKNIARIAALVGVPLWIDSATDQFEKGLFARACVRIDLSKPLKAGVWAQQRHDKFFQPLEYEGLLVFYYWCCQVGHKESMCKLPASSQGGKHDGAPPLYTNGSSSVAYFSLDSMPPAQPAVVPGSGPTAHAVCNEEQSSVAPSEEDCRAGP